MADFKGIYKMGLLDFRVRAFAESPDAGELFLKAIPAFQGRVHGLASEIPQYRGCRLAQAFFMTAMHASRFVRSPQL